MRTEFWLATRDVAEQYPEIGSAATLKRYRRIGRGPTYHRIGGRVRYRRADVEEYIEGTRVDPTSSTTPTDVEATA